MMLMMKWKRNKHLLAWNTATVLCTGQCASRHWHINTHYKTWLAFYLYLDNCSVIQSPAAASFLYPGYYLQRNPYQKPICLLVHSRVSAMFMCLSKPIKCPLHCLCLVFPSLFTLLSPFSSYFLMHTADGRLWSEGSTHAQHLKRQQCCQFLTWPLASII